MKKLLLLASLVTASINCDESFNQARVDEVIEHFENSKVINCDLDTIVKLVNDELTKLAIKFSEKTGKNLEECKKEFSGLAAGVIVNFEQLMPTIKLCGSTEKFAQIEEQFMNYQMSVECEKFKLQLSPNDIKVISDLSKSTSLNFMIGILMHIYDLSRSEAIYIFTYHLSNAALFR